MITLCVSFFFFFNDTATTEIYTLSLHDALPIYDVHRRQAAVARDPGAMPDDARMTLRRGQHVFGAVVHELHRPARRERRKRGVACDHRRIVLLATEPAARFRLDDADAIATEAEQHRQCAMHVIGALQRTV